MAAGSHTCPSPPGSGRGRGEVSSGEHLNQYEAVCEPPTLIEVGNFAS
jgi:hypothetical protein